jgi:hypothetical protein
VGWLVPTPALANPQTKVFGSSSAGVEVDRRFVLNCVDIAPAEASPSTRLETRTKESSKCASRWVQTHEAQ